MLFRSSDGSPVTGAVVTLFREGIFVTTCITDAAGVYRFDNLVEANYNVKVTYPNGTLLWVDYTSSRGTLISPLSTSITTSASFTITTSGSSTTVSISSAGSRYSYYCPPLVTTDDGYAARASVSFTTGSLTGLSGIASGTGSATTAVTSTISEPEPSSAKSTASTFANTTYGTSTGADNGMAFYYALQDIYAAVNNDAEPWYSILMARIGPAYPPWSDPPSVSQNGSAWRKKYDYYFNTRLVTDGVSAIRAACVAWYPAGTVTVYGNSPESLNILRSYDGFSQISLQTGSGVEGIGVFRVWNMVILDLSSYAHEIPSIPPGLLAWNEYPLPDFGCGWHNSYADFIAIRAAVNKRQTAYDRKKYKNYKTLDDLPASWFKTMMGLLGYVGLGNFAAAWLDHTRYIVNYNSYFAMESLAEQRYKDSVNLARALYGDGTKAYNDAVKLAASTLNAEKGFMANEFAIKPALEFLANWSGGGIPSAALAAVDYLRGVGTGTTKQDVINEIAPYITSIVNTGYQLAETPAAAVAAGVAIMEVNPVYGTTLILGGLAEWMSGSGQSPTKAVEDLITQTQGTQTQPSWLSGQTYDTLDPFSFLSPSTAGRRISFTGSGYTSTPIAEPLDMHDPMVWDPVTKTFSVKASYTPVPD